MWIGMSLRLLGRWGLCRGVEVMVVVSRHSEACGTTSRYLHMEVMVASSKDLKSSASMMHWWIGALPPSHFCCEKSARTSTQPSTLQARSIKA